MLIVYSLVDDMICYLYVFVFFFQTKDGIRDLVRSRGLGDVYKRQPELVSETPAENSTEKKEPNWGVEVLEQVKDIQPSQYLSLIHI